MTNRVLIIAEAGVNHNGSLDLAKQLVAQAAAAGADLVKFQTFITKKCISVHAPKAEYQKQTTGSDESQLDMVQKLELSRADHEALIAECKKHGIGFFSTAFDEESFQLLLELGLAQVKVPSGELTNLPFLRTLASRGLPLILSTGMASLEEVQAAVRVVEAAGTPRGNITVLQCTTEYPAPMADLNLKAMQTMGAELGVAVGYSDHSLGIEASIAAVAMGATVIEKHFTLDKTLPGPDHRASLEPQEFTALVKAIRNVEQALGDGVKRPSASEYKNIAIARKSIVAVCAIAKGDLFTTQNLTTKRPGSGLSPMQWDAVLGQAACRDFAADELIAL